MKFLARRSKYKFGFYYFSISWTYSFKFKTLIQFNVRIHVSLMSQFICQKHYYILWHATYTQRVYVDTEYTILMQVRCLYVTHFHWYSWSIGIVMTAIIQSYRIISLLSFIVCYYWVWIFPTHFQEDLSSTCNALVWSLVWMSLLCGFCSWFDFFILQSLFNTHRKVWGYFIPKNRKKPKDNVYGH